jgi:xanthine dehydrogenase small subunit
MAAVNGCHIVSIEGLNNDALTPIQQALVDNGGIQCGFCTPGFVVAITAYFLTAETANLDDFISAVAGNLCRCTGYMGVKRTLRQLLEQYPLNNTKNRLQDLIAWGFLPGYFAQIPTRLATTPALSIAPKLDAVMVAGGTDLFVQHPQTLAATELHLLDNQQKITLNGQICCIKATTTLETLKNSPVMQALFPKFHHDMEMVATTPIRERATIGGNLVNASPIADMAVFLLALAAQLELRSLNGETRIIALKNFYQAYKQMALQKSEQIENIRFACPQQPMLFSFEKVSKRQYSDIASVNCALSLELQQNTIKTVHLSAGGVAAIPLYLHKTCAHLQDKSINAELIKQALKIAQTEISPISDQRGSAEYKRLLLRQLIIGHFLKLLPNLLSIKDLL